MEVMSEKMLNDIKNGVPRILYHYIQGPTKDNKLFASLLI